MTRQNPRRRLTRRGGVLVPAILVVVSTPVAAVSVCPAPLWLVPRFPGDLEDVMELLPPLCTWDLRSSSPLRNFKMQSVG